MKIMFAASEAEPFIKTGGLGDVAGALPKELSNIPENEVCVILPYYKSIKENKALNIEYVCNFYVPLSWRNSYVGIFKTKIDKLTYYFVDNEYYFSCNGYGYNDDVERFAFFDKAVLESILHIGFVPDVLHCNDWQCGFIPLFLKAHYEQMEMYRQIKTLFTIHNIEYQGKALKSFRDEVLGVSPCFDGVIDFDNMVNAMKTGIVMSDIITTVSQTYSYEIRYKYFAYGLENILNENSYKLKGITNGIDTKSYNPASDSFLPYPYDGNNLEGKKLCKARLQKDTGLFENPDVPVVAIVSRLVSHKGLELIEWVADELANQNLQLIILGTGDKRYEDLFRTLDYRYHGRVCANIFFSQELARRIYAGADFLLMPSKCEPCGLSQMIAMRYGTIPIVRETGGLCDTVTPLNTENLFGDGFTFKSYNAHDMLGAVKRAVDFYYNAPEKLEIVRKNIMEKDFSWEKSAREYMQIYK